MANRVNNVSANAKEPAEAIGNYSLTYLNQYWPKTPDTAVGWADNSVLMLAYQEAALSLKSALSGKPFSLLDLSSGPALAPLLAMVTCVSEVQLSDYVSLNRDYLASMPIEYWRNYVPMLTKLYKRPDLEVDKILQKLDMLRRRKTPIEIDLLKDPSLPETVDPHSYEVISMNFVADSITDNLGDYLRCLGRATEMVKTGGGFLMSAIVESDGWQFGDSALPSPSVSEEIIVDFLKSQRIEVLSISRSMRHQGLIYSGGWIVLSAVKSSAA